LKVSVCHGLRPNAFQIRLTVGWDTPNERASPRVGQWVGRHNRPRGTQSLRTSPQSLRTAFNTALPRESSRRRAS
jgi:hypothetical protein